MTLRGKTWCAICASTAGVEAYRIAAPADRPAVRSDMRLLCGTCRETADRLRDNGLDLNYPTSAGVFCALKVAVKKSRHLTGRNMFAEKRRRS